jgi:glycosyltransferase involved in cell wall biosynthesis
VTAPTAPTSPAALDRALPVLLGDLDLDRPLRWLPADGYHGVARLLVRLHTVPLGEVTVPLPRDVSPSELADQVAGQLDAAVAEHLRADGMSVPSSLTCEGLGSVGSAVCLRNRPVTGATRITVVIATRDRTDSLLRCLASIEKLRYEAFDVVVVDNCPGSPRTAAAIQGRDWPFPLRYLRADRPGLAIAHNAALPQVTGELVAFTDDDVEVDPYWLAAIAEAFAEPGPTCVTGLILPAELDTPAQQLLEEFGGFARGFRRRSYSLADPPADPLFPFTVGQCGSGANMTFRTEWLRDTAGFDPATGTGTPARGGDDLTAFLDVLLGGGVIVYSPAALVRHWHRRDHEALRRQADGYGRGFGAYVAASVIKRPGLIWMMLRRAPGALAYLRDPGSRKNAGKGPDYPNELTSLERSGQLRGATGYLRSRWVTRRERPNPRRRRTDPRRPAPSVVSGDVS